MPSSSNQASAVVGRQRNCMKFEHRRQVPLEIRNQYPKGRTSFLREETVHWAIKPDEQPFVEAISKNYKDRHVIQGRCAHITQPQQIHYDQGRAQCQHRSLCNRGCPFGDYFSSNASTLPWAAKTGNMTPPANYAVKQLKKRKL